jgi:mannose-6-phosphate isomerase-like protein (cupin superfamily)
VNIKRLAHHHDFLPAGHTSRIGSVWVVELEAGEATDPRLHDDLEEIYCMVEGEGEIVVAESKRPVRAGEVVHVPALTRHWLQNPFPRKLRCITVESVADEAPADTQPGPAADADTGPQPQERAAESAGVSEADATALADSVGALEQVILDMPDTMDRVAAIQKIVSLFDIAGQLSERIEQAFGLDNERGVNALTRIERRVMDAVVEVTRRYTFDDNNLDLGSFGGRLGKRK